MTPKATQLFSCVQRVGKIILINNQWSDILDFSVQIHNNLNVCFVRFLAIENIT